MRVLSGYTPTADIHQGGDYVRDVPNNRHTATGPIAYYELQVDAEANSRWQVDRQRARITGRSRFLPVVLSLQHVATGLAQFYGYPFSEFSTGGLHARILHWRTHRYQPNGI